MQRIIRNYVESVEFASTPDQLRDAVAHVIRLFDFNAFAFLALPECKPPILISSYDDKWQGHYVERGYQNRDPVMLNSRCVVDLFTWGREMATRFGPLAEDFFYEAETFDIRSGVTVPIPNWPGGFAAMTFATDQRHARLTTCLQCNAGALLFVTAHVQSRLRRMLEPAWLIEDAALTPREYTCLKWFAEGKSQTDTAQIMDVTSRKVARDMENLRAKLGVRTINQAIAIYAAYEATRIRKH